MTMDEVITLKSILQYDILELVNRFEKSTTVNIQEIIIDKNAIEIEPGQYQYNNKITVKCNI